MNSEEATNEALALARLQQVNNMNPFVIRVGSDRKEVTETHMHGWRTEAQFLAVKKIAASPEFDFSSSPSPIFASEKGRGRYAGDYTFTFWTKDGSMHTATIHPDGSVVDRVNRRSQPEV